jgi:hypothetical protein
MRLRLSGHPTVCYQSMRRNHDDRVVETSTDYRERKQPMTRTLVLAFACAITGSSLASFGAQSFPISSLDAQLAAPEVTLVAGGCGIGFHPGPYGGCRPNGPVVVAPVVTAPVVVAPAVVVAPPVVCGVGFRWHPRFRRCVVL